MHDSDAHVYMSHITSESLKLTEDSERPPSPTVQPSPEVLPHPPLPHSAASIAPLQAKTSPSYLPQQSKATYFWHLSSA